MVVQYLLKVNKSPKYMSLYQRFGGTFEKSNALTDSNFGQDIKITAVNCNKRTCFYERKWLFNS